MRNLGRIFLCLALAALAAGCTEWNSGVSAVNHYVATQTTAQQKLLQGVNDNNAAAWAAYGCSIPYGELVRNGSGNTALAKAIVSLCGAPSGMTILSTSDSGATKVLAADGYTKTTTSTASTTATASTTTTATAATSAEAK